MTRISLLTPPPGILSVRIPTGPAPSRERPGRPCSLSPTACALRNANRSCLSILVLLALDSLGSTAKHKTSSLARRIEREEGLLGLASARNLSYQRGPCPLRVPLVTALFI